MTEARLTGADLLQSLRAEVGRIEGILAGLRDAVAAATDPASAEAEIKAAQDEARRVMEAAGQQAETAQLVREAQGERAQAVQDAAQAGEASRLAQQEAAAAKAAAEATRQELARYRAE
jgi:hypothetical protein